MAPGNAGTALEKKISNIDIDSEDFDDEWHVGPNPNQMESRNLHFDWKVISHRERMIAIKIDY